MGAREVGRTYAILRMGFGAAALATPGFLLRALVGRGGDSPVARVALRATGVRDAVIGLIALHTLDNPQVGPRWQRTCGVVDAVDGLAMLAARGSVPAVRVGAFVAVAASGAATGAWVGRELASATPADSAA